MRYTVTCDVCGRRIESGLGDVARWQRPHESCPADAVTVTWIETDCNAGTRETSVAPRRGRLISETRR